MADASQNNPKKEFTYAMIGTAAFLAIVLLIGISAFLRPAGNHDMPKATVAEPAKEEAAKPAAAEPAAATDAATTDATATEATATDATATDATPAALEGKSATMGTPTATEESATPEASSDATESQSTATDVAADEAKRADASAETTQSAPAQ